MVSTLLRMTSVADAVDVGYLLKTWRECRRFSQLELSNRSRVSTRHLQLIARSSPTWTSSPLPSVITGPVLTLELETGSGVLRFFSTSAQLDTASDATLAGLHLETFLPADGATRQAVG